MFKKGDHLMGWDGDNEMPANGIVRHIHDHEGIGLEKYYHLVCDDNIYDLREDEAIPYDKHIWGSLLIKWEQMTRLLEVAADLKTHVEERLTTLALAQRSE